MSDAAPMLTPKQLAGAWGCSVQWIYQEIDVGRLKAHWLGGWKVDPQEADRFKAAQTYSPPPVIPRRKPGPKKQKYVHVRKGV